MQTRLWPPPAGPPVRNQRGPSLRYIQVPPTPVEEDSRPRCLQATSLPASVCIDPVVPEPRAGRAPGPRAPRRELAPGWDRKEESPGPVQSLPKVR